MTSHEARLVSPKLLPGVSAGTWARVVLWVWIATGIVVVLGFIFQYASPLEHVLPFPGIFLVFPGIAVSVAIQLLAIAGLPNEKAEVRAGYTTLHNKYANLEQLDPRTGAVVRAAGEPYLRRSGRARDVDPTGDVAVTSRPSILRRIAPTLLGFVGSAIFVLVVYALVGALSKGLLTGLLIVWPSVFLIYAIAIGIGSIGVRRQLHRLRAEAPFEFAFVFRTSRGLTSAMQALVPINEPAAPGLTPSRQATASASGITFWQGNPPHRVATLPWTKVISVQQDTVRIGRSANPSVVVTFRDTEADAVVALPLMSAEANYLPLQSVAEARWIASELNQLRTGSTSARLI